MTTDYWPTPDDSTLEAAARAGLAAEHPGWTQRQVDVHVPARLASPSFQATVAAVWADRLPTPDAYYAACRAVEKHRALLDLARAVRGCRRCGRSGGELTENGCPSCGPEV